MSDTDTTTNGVDTERGKPPPPQGVPEGIWNDLYDARRKYGQTKDLLSTTSTNLGKAETENAALKRQIADLTTRHSVDMAIVRAGITDPEDIAEFRDRYGRLDADENGKRRDPNDWMKGIKESPPKWAKAYLPEPKAEPTEPADPEAQPVDPAVKGKEEPRGDTQAERRVEPPSNPNGGTVARGTPGQRRFTDDVVRKMTDREMSANMGAILKDAEADGELRISPELRKKLGG